MDSVSSTFPLTTRRTGMREPDGRRGLEANAVDTPARVETTWGAT